MKQERKKTRRSGPEKVPMLGMAWVTLSDGRHRRAVIQKISLEAKEADQVGIRMSGFLISDPGEKFEDAEVVGHFTPLGKLWKALEQLFTEREGRKLLNRAHTAKMTKQYLAGLKLTSTTTFAHTA